MWSSSVEDLKTQVDDLAVSYTIVSNIVVGEGVIDVTYAVEKAILPVSCPIHLYNRQ